MVHFASFCSKVGGLFQPHIGIVVNLKVFLNIAAIIFLLEQQRAISLVVVKDWHQSHVAFPSFIYCIHPERTTKPPPSRDETWSPLWTALNRQIFSFKSVYRRFCDYFIDLKFSSWENPNVGHNRKANFPKFLHIVIISDFNFIGFDKVLEEN